MIQKIPVETKKRLGYIIRVIRILKLNEFKKQSMEKNPFLKINFCEKNKICHYHSLTKLENDFIKDDEIYYILLEKLGLSFKITKNEHQKNLEVITDILPKLFQAIEYLDDDLIKELKCEVDSLNFNNDCITLVYYRLISFLCNLYFFKKIEDKDIEELLIYHNFYDGLFKGIYYFNLGIYYLNKLELVESEKFLMLANEIFEKYSISKGVINSSFISILFLKRNYLELVNLCFNMEIYFKKTKNNKRLMFSYVYLSEYYTIIQSKELADENFQKTMQIIKRNKELKRYEYVVLYNFGISCVENYHFEEAFVYINDSINKQSNNAEKIKAINVLLFVVFKLKKKIDISKWIDEGIRCYNDALVLDQIIFKYFKFKYENNPYYRKYAIDKVLPALKSKSTRIDFVLLLYEDLYES